MVVPPKRRLRMLFLLVVGWILCGCQSQTPENEFDRLDDLDDYEEFIAREEALQMIHRRTILEVSGGGFFPVESNFEIGGGIGVKAEMEVAKNLYLGLAFNWVHQEIDEDLSDILAGFQGGQDAAIRKARDADPEQWLESLDRYNILAVFDYDIPFWIESPAPIFRFGSGIGVVIIEGDGVDGTFAEDFDGRTFVQFLWRPWLGLRVPLSMIHPSLENLLVFTEASYEFIPEDELTVDGDLFGRRTSIDGDVDFTGFNIVGGLSFTW